MFTLAKVQEEAAVAHEPCSISLCLVMFDDELAAPVNMLCVQKATECAQSSVDRSLAQQGCMHQLIQVPDTISSNLENMLCLIFFYS